MARFLPIRHLMLVLMSAIVGACLLTSCAATSTASGEADGKDDAPTLVVTGSRIPHKVPGGKPTGVKTISREGFEEDMKGNQMPHRQGG